MSSINKIQRHAIYLQLVFVSAMTFSGCNLINPQETIPAYIYIKPFTLNTTVETQGYPSGKITDAWVYVNGIFIGAYEIPSAIPVLSEGETDIIIYPGIKENGISGVGMIYPFYNAYTITKTLTAGVTDSIQPTTTYKPSTGIQFDLLERFESSNIFEGVESEVALTTTTDPLLVFEGNRSAIANFTSTLDTFRVISGVPITFPGADKQMFLELDYYCDIPFNVWVKCNTLNQPVYDEVLTVSARDYWNKIYINLNTSLQFFSQYQPESIQLELRAIHSDTTTAKILLDNIKIVRTK